MGELAEPFHGLENFHCDERKVIDVAFDVGACRKASAEVGGFNFHMGDRSEPLGDGSGMASHGVEAFFQLSDAAKVSCNAGDHATNVFCEEDESAKLDWVSPRISFSQDLSMEEMYEFGALKSSRGVLEKRKWQEGESGEADDGSSAEFEFSKDDVILGCVSRPANDLMLSADELFFDGKLLPLQTPQAASLPSVRHGEISVCRCKHSMQECQLHEFNAGESHQNSIAEKLDLLQTKQIATSPATTSSDTTVQKSKMTIEGDNEPSSPDDRPKHPGRHHSLDLLKPVASAIMHGEGAPLASFSVDNSPCSSPQRAISVPSSSVTAPKAISKQMFRIKDLFKSKRVSSPLIPQLTRDNSTAAVSTCRIPIPPRAFWPFSRSNSAGESKTTTPPPPKLPPRSNSAGESNTSRVSPACKGSTDTHLLQASNNSSPGHAQVIPRITRTEEAENLAERIKDAAQSSDNNPNAEIANHEEESAGSSSAIDGTTTSGAPSEKGRVSTRSPGRTSRKKYTYTSANFLRGSPGRRGGLNAFGRMNNSRRVLRNLERCTAERKLCHESSSRRHATISYPMALRVSPVINVAVYRGKMPASGMFGLGSLFSSKKGKAKENELPVNNWRNGAR